MDEPLYIQAINPNTEQNFYVETNQNAGIDRCTPTLYRVLCLRNIRIGRRKNTGAKYANGKST